MRLDEIALADHTSRQHGLITRAQLLEVGASRARIDTLTTSGRFEILGNGVYRLRGCARSFEQSVAIGCLMTDGSACRATAGRLFGMRRLGHDPRIHILVHNDRRLSDRRYLIHRTRLIPPTHLLERDDGIRLTTQARTAADLVGEIGIERVESIVEQALDRQTATIEDFVEVARQLRKRGRRGIGLFDDMLSSREAWRRPVGSDYELRFAHALEGIGAPPPVRQHPIRLRGGAVVHPDLAWPEHRFVVEVNHSTWHGRAEQTHYDAWRYRELRIIGWAVEVVTDHDIDARLMPTARDIAALLRQRSSVSSTSTSDFRSAERRTA